ncbi:hypothetical protein [Paenalcaligenes sp. Me131]
MLTKCKYFQRRGQTNGELTNTLESHPAMN